MNTHETDIGTMNFYGEVVRNFSRKCQARIMLLTGGSSISSTDRLIRLRSRSGGISLDHHKEGYMSLSYTDDTQKPWDTRCANLAISPRVGIEEENIVSVGFRRVDGKMCVFHGDTVLGEVGPENIEYYLHSIVQIEKILGLLEKRNRK